MIKKIRTFIAVPVPVFVQENIGILESDLKQYRADVKWVPKENIHITLKFLGDVDETRVEELVETTQRTVSGLKPFTLSVKGTGLFPDRRRPRILWVGVDMEVDRLADLAARIDEAAIGLGFEKERRKFSAHITIGRVRSGNRIQDCVDGMEKRQFNGGSFEVREVAVMKSDLLKSGAVYTTLYRIKFNLRGFSGHG